MLKSIDIANHLWGKNTLDIANVSVVGQFKRFERHPKTNEMLPVIVLKPLTGKKLERRELTPVEFEQILFFDVWHNEKLFDVSYIAPNDSIHTRLEVANKYNGIQNQFTIH